MLKNDSDYDTPDEAGEQPPPDPTIRHRSTETRRNDACGNATIQETSSARRHHELATHDDDQNNRSAIMVRERNVIAPLQIDRPPIETSMLQPHLSNNEHLPEESQYDTFETGPTSSKLPLRNPERHQRRV